MTRRTGAAGVADAAGSCGGGSATKDFATGDSAEMASGVAGEIAGVVAAATTVTEPVSVPFGKASGRLEATLSVAVLTGFAASVAVVGSPAEGGVWVSAVLATGVEAAVVNLPSVVSVPADGRTTTVVAAGGATVEAGFGAAGAAPAGGRAITVLAGGATAIAGAAITLGAGRGCGTILRGSGLAGMTWTTGGCETGLLAGVAGLVGVGVDTGTGLRTICSACCLLARIAFNASPGLEIPDKSIFGRISVSTRAPAALAPGLFPFFR